MPPLAIVFLVFGDSVCLNFEGGVGKLFRRRFVPSVQTVMDVANEQ
jgi:hypothetical protein